MNVLKAAFALAAALGLQGCATGGASRVDAQAGPGIAEQAPQCDVPMRPLEAAQRAAAPKTPATPFGWGFALKKHCPEWYTPAPRTLAKAKPWPENFDPQRNPVFAYNEIFIPNVAPARVFAALTDAAKWPAFYPNSDAVTVEGGGALRAGSRFTWKTFSTKQQSAVLLYEQDRALGWSAESAGTHAFHRWLLEPKDGGTLLVTEECQYGWLAAIDRWIMNPALRAAHQLWLERFKRHLGAS